MDDPNSKEFYTVRCREYLMDYGMTEMMEGVDDDGVIREAHLHRIQQLARQFNPSLPKGLETVFYYYDPRHGKQEKYYVFGNANFIIRNENYVCHSCIASSQFERMLKWNRNFSIDTTDLRPFFIAGTLELRQHYITVMYMAM